VVIVIVFPFIPATTSIVNK